MKLFDEYELVLKEKEKHPEYNKMFLLNVILCSIFTLIPLVFILIATFSKNGFFAVILLPLVYIINPIILLISIITTICQFRVNKNKYSQLSLGSTILFLLITVGLIIWFSLI